MKPLAERMRPDTFEQMVGQQHLVGPGSILRNLGKSGHLPSMIFWGPPGSGKTTLAHILSKSLNRVVYSLSAVNSGVREVREVFEKIHKSGLFSGSTPILFIDEIHRFSKSQQDSLLLEVEKG
ncbi:MAG: AAA family ATPase, partial [Spirochaetia bacterium]|nr:AAA family ATPase [Spirochaetia bacterium]